MLFAVLNALCLCALSAECFRKLQGLSYRPQRGYVGIVFSPYFAALLGAFAVGMTVYFCKLPEYVSTIVYGVTAVVFAVIPRKVRLKMTKRVWRMYILQLALLLVACCLGLSPYCAVALPLIALVSLALCLPIELLIARYYIKKAQRKLTDSGLTVVAITGSYGKTSVKDMLTTLLNDSIAPAGSCNTPLGIAGFVNRTDLSNAKYLVLEFGARRRGDIAELCQLYRPRFGVVTGVCAQHLSTFKAVENIIATKRELVEYLPEDGECVLNSMCPTALSYANAGVCKTVTSADNLTVTPVKVTVDGTDIEVTASGVMRQIRLPQITAHVSDTLQICVQMCMQLGQSFDETLQNVKNVRQTPHRMELIKTPNCLILDDSYNGSIKGVESCCNTLNNLRIVNKVVITQGLVECGKLKRELNVKCGKLLGQTCSAAIVLGGNKKYLIEGLRQTDCKVLTAKKLKQAVDMAQPYLNGADNSLLLFQNDLPD